MKQPFRNKQGNWENKTVDALKKPPPPIKHPDPPMSWSTPPPWVATLLANLHMERPLDSDAEGEYPIVLIEVEKTFDEAISRINSLPFPFMWLTMVKNGSRTGDATIVLLRLDVVIQKCLAGRRVKTGG